MKRVLWIVQGWLVLLCDAYGANNALPPDVSSPLTELLLVFGLLLLVGLALMGNVCLLWTIRSTGKRKGWNRWMTNALVTCQFVVAFLAMAMAPAILFRRIKADSTYELTITIALVSLAIAYVVFVVLRQWSSFFSSDVTDPGKSNQPDSLGKYTIED